MEVVSDGSHLVLFLFSQPQEHNLQDPNNGQQILFDDKLQAVFKVKKTTFFKLNKLLVKHLGDPDELV